ncbi:MAG: ribbon-helix-helix domain-containing protein [Gaiellales bacterium]
MKLSVSLPEEDVAFLDAYARAQGIDSRSAALHKAVEVLRAAALESAYEQAWLEWSTSGAAGDWETTVADGLPADPTAGTKADAPR